MASQALLIGDSYLLSCQSFDVDHLIDIAAKATFEHPEVATEITLATTKEVLRRYVVQDALHKTLSSMVNKLCIARDLSLAV